MGKESGSFLCLEPLSFQAHWKSLCGYKYWVRELVKNQARALVITRWGGTRTG